MAGLVPAIHVFCFTKEDVDARHKAGHDERDALDRFPHGTQPRDVLCCTRAPWSSCVFRCAERGMHMSLGLILVIILIIFLLGGFSGRFGGYGYGMGHSGMGLGGLILVVLLVLLLLGKL
jgi:hypothetical protein